MASQAVLLTRGVIAVSGADAAVFLQGLITQDMRHVHPQQPCYAALLTPQGKFLFDFFIWQAGENFLLEGDADRVEALLTRLQRYRLRSQVSLTDVTAEYQALAVVEGALPQGVLPDPRDAGMGGRALLPIAKLPAFLHRYQLHLQPFEVYEARRIARVLPEAGKELIPEQTLLLEAHFEALHGVDFTKGCYVGQEVTARSKHRATLRKQLYGVHLEGEAGDARVITQDAKEVGDLRSHRDAQGIAMLRVEAVENGLPLHCGKAFVWPFSPPYL